jgi:undecaprenyl pyrophosphate synthase
VKFPGRKLLHEWTLTPAVSLEDVLRPCHQVGLTGFCELRLGRAEAVIFYYMGSEVSAVCREGSVAHHGPAAFKQLRTHLGEADGTVAIYEVPMDMAHLLRGLSKRHKLPEPLKGRQALVDLLQGMQGTEHTGTVEIQTPTGGAMVLVVNGRVSNVYWETTAGSVFEKEKARSALDQALDQGTGTVYRAEFSREAWRSRQDVEASVPTHFAEPAEPPPAETRAAEETRERVEVLEDLQKQLPALLQGYVFDLLTGAVLARKNRGATALQAALLAGKIPSVATFVRELVLAEAGDQLELLEVGTDRVDIVLAAVPELQEAIVVVADKAQPTAHVRAVLVRLARSYAARATAARHGVGIGN